MENRSPTISLQVEHYDQCVAFYSKVLQLPILSQTEDRTDLQFHQDHLLLEKAQPRSRHAGSSAPGFFLWINTVSMDLFQAKGLKFQHKTYDWAEFHDLQDPDGNWVRLCQFR